MDLIHQGVGPLRLTPRDFLAGGGQGDVYVRGDEAYKVFRDPAGCPPEGKLLELSTVADPWVVLPRRLLLSADGVAVGYSMPFLSDTWPLCRLFPRPFREAHGLTLARRVALVRGLARTLAHLHARGVLAVDLNEMNGLVTPAFDGVHLIDADSFQTPSYPATAIADPVRDRHAPPGVFGEGTDWFAFAVTAFQLLVGMHPYRGAHPDVKGLDARMEANLSVFDPAVTVPKAAEPLANLPRTLHDWFASVFELGERSPPPLGDLALPAPKPPPATTSRGLVITPVFETDAPILAYAFRHGVELAVTAAGVLLDRRPAGPAPTGRPEIAFTRGGRPVVCGLGDEVTLWDPTRRARIPLGLRADAAVVYDDRLYVRAADRLVEVRLFDSPGGAVATHRPVGNVHPRATALFPGVAVQSLLGATYASVFEAPGRCPQLRLPELDGHRVVDARYDRGVLMLVGVRGGRYDRFVLRIDGTRYDLRRTADIPYAGLDFVVLDRGLCLHLTESEALDLFPAGIDAPGLRTVTDPLLGGDLRLHRYAGQAAFVRGGVVSRFSLR